MVETFIEHVEEFDRTDRLAGHPGAGCFERRQSILKQARSLMPAWRPDILGVTEEASGFRSISEAQREVFALHEIAQTIGSSLNLSDTVTLVANKLRAIVPFDTCVIYLVDEPSGKAIAAHVVGEEVGAVQTPADKHWRRHYRLGDRELRVRCVTPRLNWTWSGFRMRS